MVILMTKMKILTGISAPGEGGSGAAAFYAQIAAITFACSQKLGLIFKINGYC